MASIIRLILTCFLFKEIRGADPFEVLLLTRFQCYGTEQPGCSTDFIDAHPEFSMSHTNITRADTYMYLFTPNNKDTPELLHKCPDALPPRTLFNPRFRTEIIIPGLFSGICNFAVFREIKNELLKKGDRNVILIDWTWGNSFDLKDSNYNVRTLSRQVAALIDILKKKFNLSPKDFICTGHSYGSHGCGLVGQKTRIAIINGLDPNGITKTKQTPLDDRLDPGDADCVQAIHTNCGQCLPAFGTNFTLGTVDIYFNGGKRQNAAYKETQNAFAKGDFVYALFSFGAGYHLQALQYYKASINAEECQFIAVKCRNYKDFKKGQCSTCGQNGQNCILVGPECCDCLNPDIIRQKRTRKYYLNTDDNCPYCNNSKVDISGYHCKKADV